MSHKECSCNDCQASYVYSLPEKPGDDKLLKQPIRLMEPPVETFLFTPEDEDEAIEAGVRSAIPQFENPLLASNRAFKTKDSGQRQEFSTGMVRDVSTDKIRYDLVYMPMFKRWAELMTRGAKKYSAHNWKKAATQEELDRFKESAFRHFMEWFLDEETGEDSAAGIFFNVSGVEYVKTKLGGIVK